ncbi:MAG: SDR family NAD(P)-dependent oxidoreductase [Caldimonas sp.]
MFADKVVLVTGASSEIGRATAIAFAREGAQVVRGWREGRRRRPTSPASTASSG